MSQNQVRNLVEKVACKEKKICNLKEKLNSLNKTIALKDALEEQLDKLQRRVEEEKIIQKRTNDEQLNCIKCQNKKLEKAEINMNSLRSENHKLNDINNCQVDQLKKLQRNEQKLIVDVENLETSNKNLKKELYNVEVSIIKIFGNF